MTEIDEIIKSFHEKLPKFLDGRIDYHSSDTAPVVTIFVEFGRRILLLKRSKKVGTYQEKWSTVTGSLDDLKPIEDKVFEELQEETAITKNNIKKLYFGKLQTIKDRKIGKTWIIQPVLAILKEKPNIKLDFEHTEHKWINPNDLKKYDIDVELNKTFTLVEKYFDR